jgi:hypothetical protein
MENGDDSMNGQLGWLLLMLAFLPIAACESKDSKSATPANPYIQFPGNANMNGTAVLDANGHYTRFLSSSRTMEKLGSEGKQSSITVDANYNLVRENNQNIGKVELIAGNQNDTVSAMIGSDGFALALVDEGKNISLTTSKVSYAKPGSSTGNKGTSSGGSTSGDVSRCKEANYAGPTTSPQADSYCKMAFIDQCLDQATGQKNYESERQSVCGLLDGLLKSTGGGSATSYCTYCR